MGQTNRLDEEFVAVKEDPEILFQLGQIVVDGMKRVDSFHSFTGEGVDGRFLTNFDMPDGKTWYLTLQNRKPD